MFYCKIALTGFMCQMPVIFCKMGTLSYAAQCHLVKSVYRKYFYKLPKCRLLANPNVLPWKSCTKPLVLKPCFKMFRRNIKGFMHHCVRVQAGACFFHGRHFGFASASRICNF